MEQVMITQKPPQYLPKISGELFFQRKRDDNKNNICVFQGWVGRGAERKIFQNAIFRGKRHDNKILNVKILLSRNFVVMAQAHLFGGSQVIIIWSITCQKVLGI